MKSTAYDIVVVGAGMVGAALALALTRAGWQVALIDRAAPVPFEASQRPDLRVSAISSGSERWLRELGVWEGIVQRRSTPFRRMSVWEQQAGLLAQIPALAQLSARARTTFDAADLKRPQLGHIVENPVTQSALWEALEADGRATLLAPATLVSLTQDEQQATVTLKDQILTAPLVIAADGAASMTRQQVSIGTSSDQYQQHAMVITVAHEAPAQDITWQMFTPTGPRAYLPLPTIDGQCWGSLVWYHDPHTLDRLAALDETALLDAIRDAFPEELPRLQGAPAHGRFPIARQHAHQYSKGRVVLVGDAAHTINPLAGQGLNLGFQDAQCLSRLLTQARRQQGDPGASGLLQAYEQERRPENTLMMTAMDLFYHGFSNRHPPLKLLRNLGLGLAGSLSPARNEVARFAMGLDGHLSRPMKTLLRRLPL
ncbi:MAG: FAD-dependent oxidoreductase [Halomonadaceae bacterium]|nr:MAG: FAD-dependent oxidoreductase [Halomonadaceae bacterium]